MDIELPTDLDEALAAAGERPEALWLAGGTDLMVDLNFGHADPPAVIALRRVEELAEWEDGFIGAGVTYSRLEGSHHPALAELARTVGSPQIRNAGTLGGNLGTASPAGDTLPFLAALEAHVEVQSAAGGRRSMPFAEFMIGPKQTSLGPGELILGARLPDRIPERQAFAKIGQRNAMVISTVSACVVRYEDGSTRVALGSVGPTIVRATRAERMISAEQTLSEAALVEFGRLVCEEVRPITDHRATEAYRRHAAGVLARRTLERCW